MLQRELAHARTALKPYLEGGAGRLVAPLEQEVELASLYLFCDYYPDDGQLTLIEQLRDVITEHIPEEERQWLDPLKIPIRRTEIGLAAEALPRSCVAITC